LVLVCTGDTSLGPSSVQLACCEPMGRRARRVLVFGYLSERPLPFLVESREDVFSHPFQSLFKTESPKRSPASIRTRLVSGSLMPLQSSSCAAQSGTQRLAFRTPDYLEAAPGGPHLPSLTVPATDRSWLKHSGTARQLVSPRGSNASLFPYTFLF
jgi:hypothetical protein